MDNFVKINYEYMLKKLGKTPKQFENAKEILSSSTLNRIRNNKNVKPCTINALVEYYNKHGSELYPHHVEFDEFKNTDLSKSTSPKWKNKDIAGDYIVLYLSRRGTGKPKAMAMTITETPDQTLEVRAIDVVQDPTQTTDVIDNILKIDDISQAKAEHKIKLDAKDNLLRGSRLLSGTASGRGSLLSVQLSDGNGYEMTISTSLKAFLETSGKRVKAYSMRGGAAIATVTDLEDWPYSIVIGMIRRDDYWHPHKMNIEDLTKTLQRMDSYQKKENMLCLQNDIDALWYEFFMDVHRQCT